MLSNVGLLLILTSLPDQFLRSHRLVHLLPSADALSLTAYIHTIHTELIELGAWRKDTTTMQWRLGINNRKTIRQFNSTTIKQTNTLTSLKIISLKHLMHKKTSHTSSSPLPPTTIPVPRNCYSYSDDGK